MPIWLWDQPFGVPGKGNQHGWLLLLANRLE
jgi:hypothetical protein